MKRIKVEIQVTLLTIIIAAAMIGSGYLVYNSLSEIVDSIHKESRPDSRLLLLKDIASDLTEIENTVRFYSLTGDPALITPYHELSTSVKQKLTNLKDYEIPGSEKARLIDSIRQLTNEKLILLEKIRSLQNRQENTQSSFTELYSKIDTAIVPYDTIQVRKEEKKVGFLKRIFGKRESTPPPPIIVDKSEEKENIKQEIANIERQITDRNRKLQVQEKALLEQNIEITSLLMKQISTLEHSEQRRLELKTQEADFMAAQTYRRLTIFTIAAVILLMTVLIIFFRNIQRNRSYQQILKKAKAEAENLAKAKEMFVATVSHEMRTPINAIYGLTEQLLQKTNEKEVVTDLKVVHKSAEHLITLVNDTLDFSKIEAQKLKIEQLDFLPEDIFKEVYILNKNAASVKGIELIVQNYADAGLTLKGDPIRLKQILINLVSNAIKFTARGKVTLQSEYREENNLIWLIAEVTDTGIGISREDTEKIFDEFVQLDNDLTQKHRGAGLGLSIVKKLVEMQGGNISVDSIPGKGARFTVQIPYQRGTFQNVRKQSEEKLYLPAHLKKLHFLLVDDEEFNLHLLKNILKKWGVSFTEATNGKMATELASEKVFDLIFMDVRMPVLNGFEASRQILRLRPDARIIALTAANNREDIQKSKEAGMLGLLQKPFSEAELLSLVIDFFPENHVQPVSSVEPHVPVNPEELEKMSGSDKTFFKEMIKIFIKSSENALITMRQSITVQDWNAIGEAAHKLAAPAKHMAALYLYDRLKILEKEAPGGKDPSKIKKIVEEINTEIQQIHAILKQKLDQ
jgi:signal transduction histidine kinase/FixJ family two-component response regulator